MAGVVTLSITIHKIKRRDTETCDLGSNCWEVVPGKKKDNERNEREMKTIFKLFGGGDQQKIKDNKRNEKGGEKEMGNEVKGPRAEYLRGRLELFQLKKSKRI